MRRCKVDNDIFCGSLFDDIPEAAYFFPALTTIRQDAVSLGALAVDRMCSFISAGERDEEVEPVVKWIQPRLIVRQSSAREIDRKEERWSSA